MEMREMFALEIEKAMLKNENIVILNADLAKPNGFGELSKKYPERVINVGIAEQNMACVAAGMSSYGFMPFICTFTPFATRRICDQIAVSICYANQNVKIIGTDPGISAEYNGGTHMSVEDAGVLRSIPNIVIFEPVDNVQLKNMLPQILNYKGPLYIRMFRKKTTDIFDETEKFDLFKSKVIKEGKDISVFCSGIMVEETLKANQVLEEEGIDAEIINIHTWKPIAEILSEGCPVPMKSIGINDVFGQVGKMPYLKEVYHMTAKDIVLAVKKCLKLKA